MNPQDKQSLELLYEGIFSRLGAKADAVKPIMGDTIDSLRDAAKGNKEAIQKRQEGKGTVSQRHAVETVASLLKKYYFFLKDELKNCKDYIGDDKTYAVTINQLEELKSQIKDTFKDLKYGKEEGEVNIRSADEIEVEKSMKAAREKAAATRSANAAKRRAIADKRKTVTPKIK